MPQILIECVEALMAEGESESSAWANCIERLRGAGLIRWDKEAGDWVEATTMLEGIAIIAKSLGGDPPEWFRVFPAGVVEIADAEPAFLDEAGAMEIVTRFEKSSADMVIDYEHQTLSGEKAPAAGWITALQWRGDGEDGGLWAQVKWTKEAEGYIERGEYRFFSPVFLVGGEDRRIVELYNVGLTNQPRMLKIRALAAKLELTDERRVSMWERLKRLLGLGEAATESEAVEAVEALKSEVETLKGAPPPVACGEVLEALGVGDGEDVRAVVAKIRELRGARTDIEEAFQALKRSHDDLKRRMEERERDDRVAAALKSGKITPAQKEWADEYAMSDPAGFDRFIAKAPVVVPLERLPEGGGDDGGTPQERMERLIAKKMTENEGMTYADAMNLVSAENPELAGEYIEAGRGNA